jgi:3' terminal RNA ribose 2'-O-methyltransferase Hen1
MLLTISTTHEPATDLGYLLHKSPNRVHEVELTFGLARVIYSEATAERCTAHLYVEVDPVGLVRKPKDSSDSGPLVAYVNDRPYVASSMLGTALSKVFGTAMSGRSRERPDLAATAIPLVASVPVMPCRGGEAILRGVFEPLGYTVDAEPLALDPEFPAWGESRYFTVTLTATVRLADLLSHLYVLMPVLDDDKHYWVGSDEVEKLVRKGAGWLESHPMKPLIVRRALRRRQRFVREAFERLKEVESDESDPNEGAPETEEMLERTLSLHEQRIGAVVAALKASGASRVLDLGCGEGKLLVHLAAEPEIGRVFGMDVSFRSVEGAEKALQRLPSNARGRIEVAQGSLLYRDDRLKGWDAAALVEVIEHIEPDRLRWLEDAVFEFAHPKTVIVTTPNGEYNTRFPGMAPGQRRHADHRFEWSRAEFHAWSEAVCSAHGYTVRYLPIGAEDPEAGPPSQMAVFSWT